MKHAVLDEFFRMDAYDLDERSYWEELNLRGWAVATQFFDHAYETSDDSEAVSWVEDEVVPIHRYLHADGDRPDTDLDGWYDRLEEDMNLVPSNPRFRIDPNMFSYYAPFRDMVAHEQLTQGYDQLVGVYSSGMPLLYMVDDMIEDSDPVIVKYSYQKDRDHAVTVTETMADRADVDGNDILVIDDCVNTGRTMNNVASFLDRRGAARVGVVTAQMGGKVWENWFKQTDGRNLATW